jgi:hypothetical protein
MCVQNFIGASWIFVEKTANDFVQRLLGHPVYYIVLMQGSVRPGPRKVGTGTGTGTESIPAGTGIGTGTGTNI